MTPGDILVAVGEFCAHVVEGIAVSGFFPPHCQVPAQDVPIMNHCPQGKCLLLNTYLGPRREKGSNCPCMVRTCNAFLILILASAIISATNCCAHSIFAGLIQEI